MNIDARSAKLYLKPLFHQFQMLIRSAARNVKARRLSSRFLRFQADWPEAAVMHRQELFQAALPNRVFPERNFPEPGWFH
jgi:hypothetical protein